MLSSALFAGIRGAAFLPGGRRSALATGLQHLGGVAAAVALAPPLPVAAKAVKAVTKEDLQRLSDGYKDLVYLMNNWNKATRYCDENNRKEQQLQSGVKSPDDCEARPDNVRKYFGLRSLNEKLYDTQQLWINIEASGMVASEKEDEFQDLIEQFEKYKQQAGDWAYTSSWGEGNPGGGRDKVEDYLLRSKAEAQKATDTLGKIVGILPIL